MRKFVATSLIAVSSIFALASCSSSDAQTVSENLSTEADQFKVDRRIVAINTFTDEVLIEITGRCSLKRDGDVVVTCKEGPNAYKKHYMGLSDNVFWSSTQLETVDVDEYHTKIILKPESIVPNFDMETSIDIERDGDN